MDENNGKMPLFIPAPIKPFLQLGTGDPILNRSVLMSKPMSAISTPEELPSWVVSESIDFDAVIDRT
jgi:hypothetical protein